MRASDTQQAEKAPRNRIMTVVQRGPPGVGTKGRKAAGSGLPRWDNQRREMWLGRKVIKRYRQPAAEQEQILESFFRN